MNKQKVKDFVTLLDDKQASDIIVIDMENTSVLYDCFIIASVDNQRLSNAMVDYIEQMCKDKDYSVKRINGANESDWVLLDCFDVIVHLFSGNARSTYNLEKLWADCPQLDLESCMNC